MPSFSIHLIQVAIAVTAVLLVVYFWQAMGWILEKQARETLATYLQTVPSSKGTGGLRRSADSARPTPLVTAVGTSATTSSTTLLLPSSARRSRQPSRSWPAGRAHRQLSQRASACARSRHAAARPRVRAQPSTGRAQSRASPPGLARSLSDLLLAGEPDPAQHAEPGVMRLASARSSTSCRGRSRPAMRGRRRPCPSA